jgi:hypothetical protein
MKQDVGRPSKLEDKEFLLKIKNLYLDGKNEVEIQEILDIPKGTWNHWKYSNFHNFTDIMLSYKHERMLMKSETNLEDLMDADDDRVKLDASKFVAETIGKKYYSKRVDSDVTTGGDKIVFLPNQVINKLNGTTPETSGDNKLQ